jgi:hypothetical protein
VTAALQLSERYEASLECRRNGMPERAAHRSKDEAKLYVVRDQHLKDIQSYKRTHGQDVKRRGKGEHGPKT